MSYFDAIILGLLQGLTEFLPISSSGHLVLAEHLLGAKMPGVLFELVVHLGTLLSVVIYFRKRISALIRSVFLSEMKDERKLVLYLVIGTIPAVVIALLFKGTIESAFASPLMTSVFLIITGLILLLTVLPKRGVRNVGAASAIIIGIGQAIAIFPGISRSGTTISAGLFAGVKPIVAAEFSFLLSIPAIAGAIVFKGEELLSVDAELIGQYSAGMIISFFSGLLAVYILLDMVRKGRFKYFGIYCLIAGLFGVIYFS